MLKRSGSVLRSALCGALVVSGGLMLSACGAQSEAEGASGGSGTSSATADSAMPDGSAERPLRVMLIPTEGGDTSVKDDFQPIFGAISKAYDLHFDLKEGQSYAAVVEGMVADRVDIAFFGAVTLHQAQERGAAELLAVAVKKEQSIYYSGVFCRKDAGLSQLTDLKGKSMAFGDVNSTSSFNFPVAMLLNAGVDPANDLKKILMTGSHTNSIAALTEGRVDACAASYNAFEKAVKAGAVDPAVFGPLEKSDPIPYPPLAMHVKLHDDVKATLREAFANVHTQAGVTPDMIRGYGGKKVDRFDTEYPQSEFDKAISKLAKVTDDVKSAMLRKAGTR